MENNWLRRKPSGQQVEKVSASTEIALPEPQLKALREIAVSAGRAANHGAVTLFRGANGAGKTIAANALARELGVGLYRIDMTQVVSKYIGETEKNLSRVFAEAESRGAILFFDEAEALFGKRSEVKDSHDRYANIEISYFLQQMKEHNRPVILATNAAEEWAPSIRESIKYMMEFPPPPG